MSDNLRREGIIAMLQSPRWVRGGADMRVFGVMALFAAVIGVVAVMMIRKGSEARPEGQPFEEVAVLDESPRRPRETPRRVVPPSSSEDEFDSVAAAQTPLPAVHSPSSTTTPPPVRRGPVVRGTITSRESGAPIPGAEVHQYSLISAIRPPHPDARPVSLGSTTTDENGEYELRVADEMAGIPGRARLMHVSANGYESRSVMAMVEGGQELPSRTDVELGPGESVTGRVVNEAGTPIAGAAIGHLLLVDDPSSVFGAATPRSVPGTFTNSEANGQFTLTGLARGESYFVPVRAEGYIPYIPDKPIEAGARGLEIVLQAGNAAIVGSIVESDGVTPVPGAKLTLQPQPKGNFNWMKVMMSIRGTDAAADGSFRLEGLAADTYMVIAQDGGDLFQIMTTRHAMQEVTLSFGETKELKLQFPAKTILVGRAIDDLTEEPITGLRISMSHSSVQSREIVRTDLDGRFELILHPSPGQPTFFHYMLEDGWIYEAKTGMYHHHAPGMMSVQIPAGKEHHEEEFRFRRGVVVRARVLESDGTTPVETAQVQFMAKGDGGGVSTTEAEGESAGKFRALLRPGSVYTVEARAEAGFTSATIQVPEQGQPQEVELILGGFAFIDGRVVDEENNPVARAELRLMRTIDVGGSRLMTGESTTADTDGGFHFDKVLPGECQLSASFPGTTSHGGSEPLNLTLEAGDYLRDQVIVLARGMTLEDIVRDREGNPIAGVQVYPQFVDHSASFGHQQTQTDEEGRFKIEGLTETRIIQYLNFNHPDFFHESLQNVRYDDAPLNVTLTRKGTRLLRAVYQGTTRPVTHYEYQIMGSWGQESLFPSGSPVRVKDEDGETTFVPPERGNWHVIAYALTEDGAAAGPKGSAAFNTGGDDELEVTVELGGGRTVRGKVTMNESMEPVAGAFVTFHTPMIQPWNHQPVMELHQMPRATTGRDGSFVLEGVLPGNHTFLVQAEGLILKERRTVEVKADTDPEPTTLIMTTHGVIHGRIIAADGRPFTKARIGHRFHDFTSNFGMPAVQEYRPDENGEYRIPNLQAGYHQLSLIDPEGIHSRDTNVNLAAGETQEVNFDLSGAVRLYGTITLNGEPLTLNDSIYVGQSGPVSTNTHVKLMPGGKYDITIPPGEYTLHVLDRLQSGFAEMERFEVAPEPKEQEKHFEFWTVTAVVVMVFPDDDDFVPGTISVMPEHDGEDQTPFGARPVHASQSSVLVPNLHPGPYKASFRSHDGKWTGTSERIELSADGENYMVIEPTSVEGSVRVGSWGPEQMGPEFTPFDIDITPNLTRAGTYEVTLDYESGSDAAEFDFVALLQNGREISRDTHLAWSGYSRRNHIYTLSVPNHREGSRYTLRVSIKGGLDSEGGVFLKRR